MNNLEIALQWYDKGINTIPLQPNSKYYFEGTSLKDYLELRDVDRIKDIFSRRCNLAVMPNYSPVAGAYLVCLDFDDNETFNQWWWDRKVETLIEYSKRGAHVFLWTILNPAEWQSKYCEIKFKSPVVASPSVVKGCHYQSNYKDIALIASVDDVIKCSPSKKKKQQVSTASNDVRPSSFTRRNPSLITDIKKHYPITAIFTDYIRSSGHMGMARCPMPAHPNGDRNPSLSLDLSTNRFRCFKPSCPLHLPRGGDVIDAYRIVNELSLRETLAMMASELGL